MTSRNGGLVVRLRGGDTLSVGEGLITCVEGRALLQLAFPPAVIIGPIVKRRIERPPAATTRRTTEAAQ